MEIPTISGPRTGILPRNLLAPPAASLLNPSLVPRPKIRVCKRLADLPSPLLKIPPRVAPGPPRNPGPAALGLIFPASIAF